MGKKHGFGNLKMDTGKKAKKWGKENGFGNLIMATRRRTW